MHSLMHAKITERPTVDPERALDCSCQQVGDASAYVVLQDPGYDPVAQGKVWTGPKQDPTLVGADPRPVWLLTGDLVGADLLSGVWAVCGGQELCVCVPGRGDER